MKNRYEQFKQNDYRADDTVTNQNTDQSTNQNTDVNMNPKIGRDGKLKRIAFLALGVIFAGAIVTGCSLLKSDGKKSIPEPIKKVANAIGISTDDYEMGSYGAVSGSQWDTYSIYKVDAKCCIVEWDDVYSIKSHTNLPEGGGMVSGAGSLSTIDDSKYLTIIPTASTGYEYVGVFLRDEGAEFFVDSAYKCFAVCVNSSRKPQVPGYKASEVYWLQNLKESQTMLFCFKKKTHMLTLSVCPQCAKLNVDTNEFGTEMPSGSSKISITLKSADQTRRVAVHLDEFQDSLYDPNVGTVYELNRDTGQFVHVSKIGGGTNYWYSEDERRVIINLAPEDANSDHDYIVVFNTKKGEAAYDYPNQIITYADPIEGGSVSGDNQGRNQLSANIKATPNDGYMFSYWSWYENGKYMTSTDNPQQVTVTGRMIFTAHFSPAAYRVTLADVIPQEACTIEGLGIHKQGAKVTLKIIPCSSDYVLREWYYTTQDGIKHSGDSDTIEITSMPAEDIFLHLSFDTNYATLKTAVSPTSGGTAVITTIPPIPAGNTETEAQFSKGTQNPAIKLNATPSTGYKFLYWTDNNGNQYADNPLEITQINQDTTYTANFAKNTVNVTVAASPGSVGGVKYKIDTEAESAMGDSFDITVNDGSRLQMTAIEHDTSYKFDHWEMIESGKDPQILTKEMVYSISSYKAPTSGAHVRYVAVFEPLQFKVEAESDPSVLSIDVTINGDSTGRVYVNADENVNLSFNNTSSEYKFEYWSDQDGHIYRNTDVTVYGVKKEMKFIAHFVKSSSNVTIRSIPEGSGKFKYDINSGGSAGELDYADVALADGANVVITAIVSNPAYTFDHWELIEMGKDPQTIGTDLVYTITSFKAPSDEKSVSYVAVFKPALCKVETSVNGGDGGKVQINGNDVTQINVEKGANAELTAVPWDEYKFDYWVDQDGNTFTDNPIKLTSIQKNMKYTAYFKKTTAKITISTIPAGVGLVKYNDSDYAELFEIDALTDDDLIMTAKEMNLRYKFDHWEIVEPGQPNKTTTVNPLSVIDLIPPSSGQLRYIAVFVPRLFTIKVEANPTEGGTVLIDERYTETGVEGGSDVTLKSYANEGYYLDYWQDSKGNRFSGQYSYADGVEINTLTISGITADETYTAVFVKGLVKINYLTAPYGVGKVDCNGYGYDYYGECDAAGGWQITLTARADNPKEYVFDYWEDNFGNKYSGNPLEISNIRKSTTFTAVFKKYSKEDSGGIIVYASPAAGGFVSKVYNGDDTATITAKANSGYTFSCWKKGKKVISRKRVATVDDLTDGTTYVAYFVKEDGSVIRTSVVDEHFYNERRHITSPTYSVTKQSMTFLAQAQIALDKARDDTPAPKKYAAFEKAAEYYENHLIEDDFVFADGELVTTRGEQMPIDYIPTGEEAFLDDAYEFTLKKFGDRYGTEILAAVDVTMPNGYEDGTRTYLWRNTGGVFKDNVYLLYARNYNSEYEWCTGVVDIDESIRFTISDPGSIVRLAAVRVKIGESDEEE